MPTGQGHERTFPSHCRTCWLSSTSLWLLLSSSSSSTSSFGSSSSPRACLGRGEEKLGWKWTLPLRFGDGVPKHLTLTQCRPVTGTLCQLAGSGDLGQSLTQNQLGERSWTQ